MSRSGNGAHSCVPERDGLTVFENHFFRNHGFRTRSFAEVLERFFPAFFAHGKFCVLE